MKLIIDDANIEKIKQLYEFFPVDGVTTNPSILARTGGDPHRVLRGLRDFLGSEGELHVQVLSTDAEGMVAEAGRIRAELGENTCVKVPVTREGLKAIRLLAASDCRVTATAVYTQMQAFLAAKAGAVYAAPYVNRIDNLGGDGVAVARDIHELFQKNGLKTQVLAASFKNCRQVLELVRCGVGAATVSPDVLEAFLKLDAVDAAVERFRLDFEGLCGAQATL